jgi:hypothetical protein
MRARVSVHTYRLRMACVYGLGIMLVGDKFGVAWVGAGASALAVSCKRWVAKNHAP